MQTLVRWSALFALTIFPSFARAQSGPPHAVTLTEVLQRARENPPAILAALATLQRTQAQEQYARGTYIPRFTVEAGSGIGYADQPYLTKENRASLQKFSQEPVPPTAQSTTQQTFGRANLDIPVLDLGRHYAVKAAHMNSDAQRSAYSAAQRSATNAGAELYMRSLAALALVEDARLTLERRTSQHDAISGLVRAGLRPSVDATRAQIEVIAAGFALQTREIEVSATGASLAAAMGNDPTQPVVAATFDDGVLPAPLPPLEASVRAVELRPEIKQLESNVASKRADHQAAIGARLPTVGLQAIGNVARVSLYHGDGVEGRTLAGSGSVYMRWAALDPTIWRRANVTRGAIEEAQRQLEATLLAVRVEVVDAAYQVQRTRAMLDQATQVLAAAEAARTAQNERYRAGVASLLDLLDAEGIEQSARRQRIEAERDQRIARVRLLAACGTIGELTK
jgi:outer membrane protein